MYGSKTCPKAGRRVHRIVVPKNFLFYLHESGVGELIMPKNWGKWVFAGVLTVSLLYFAWLLF